MEDVPSKIVVYLPLLQLAGFMAAWGLAMLTGLLFASARAGS